MPAGILAPRPAGDEAGIAIPGPSSPWSTQLQPKVDR